MFRLLKLSDRLANNTINESRKFGYLIGIIILISLSFYMNLLFGLANAGYIILNLTISIIINITGIIILFLINNSKNKAFFLDRLIILYFPTKLIVFILSILFILVAFSSSSEPSNLQALVASYNIWNIVSVIIIYIILIILFIRVNNTKSKAT
jgi:hypothetical protein